MLQFSFVIDSPPLLFLKEKCKYKRCTELKTSSDFDTTL